MKDNYNLLIIFKLIGYFLYQKNEIKFFYIKISILKEKYFKNK